MSSSIAKGGDSTALWSVRRDPQSPVFAKDFLASLVDRSVLDVSGAERAAQAQRQSGQRIDTVLTELGLVGATQLSAAIADMLALPTASEAEFPAVAIDVAGLNSEFLLRHKLLPLARDESGLRIAISDPFSDDTVRSLQFFTGLTITPVLASGTAIEKAIRRLYLVAESNGPADDLPLGPSGVNDDDLQRLREIASDAPVVRFVGRMITEAVNRRASDIHIEPLSDSLRVRYRVDGRAFEAERLTADMLAGIASRIKILAKLNIAERRLPQDGRAKFVVGGREIDVRVSTTPVLHGESIVIRILNQQELDYSLAGIGFEPYQAEAFERLLRKPNGIILVTGPTGSGKTTTLYAALQLLNSVDRTVFSVEDPVEYRMAGVNQMQIKPGIGLDFAACLRSILRQNPDIIMVGEMRDTETVRVGIQAALTGHLVLSTLHTNSAAASITRLIDMGAQDYLLSSTLNGILAQRLVRRLCTCSQPSHESTTLARRLAEASGATIDERATARVPVGCPKCGGTGFFGRTSILEILVVDTELRPLIREGVNEKDLEATARRRGMVTLVESGLRKVFDGQTSVDEVLRVAGA